MNPTYFFYDLETSGLDPREDRIMQFAGQRTDLDFNPIGDPVNLLVKLPEDTLPSPHAIIVTKITPQQTQQDGLTEAEFCKYLMRDIFTPATIATGYNSVRFDDEFMRHTLWRNFYDPYEWQWKDGRSRWDLLDVVRLTRALRPEGIVWPFDQDQKATNRLELITKLNGISHEAAHDALSDVTALIEVAKLIKQKQPKLYDYLLLMRDKKQVQKLINLADPQPFVYTSGRLASEHNKTSVFYPLAPAKNSNVLVFDLRHNLDTLLTEKEDAAKSKGLFESCTATAKKEVSLLRREAVEEGSAAPAAKSKGLFESCTATASLSAEPCDDRREDAGSKSPFDLARSFFPIVKELKYNHCPAVAPISVLDQNDGWHKIHLSKSTIAQNLATLTRHPAFAEQMRTKSEEKPDFPPAPDPESALYDGFLDHADRIRCDAVRSAPPRDLADFTPDFADPRLPELLTHYKARNFPHTLTATEQSQWEAYRAARLARQQDPFLAALRDLAPTADPFLIEELNLWHQAILP